MTVHRAVASTLRQARLDKFLRVDQAGEVAAVRIARHQLRWMSPLCDSVPIVKEILHDELRHERVMNELVQKHNVRSTSLDPIFKAGALLMAGATALLGKEAMMCCHAAVEVTIYDHYNNQLREMTTIEREENWAVETEEQKAAWEEVKRYITEFRDEERHHQELGEQNGAAQAPAYPILYNGIRMACKLGIALAERV